VQNAVTETVARRHCFPSRKDSGPQDSSVPAENALLKKRPRSWGTTEGCAPTLPRYCVLELDEKKLRYLVNEDAMATEKTAEGIRKFASDIGKLEKFVARKIN